MKKIIFVLTINLVTFIIFFSIGELYCRVKGIKPYIRTFPGQYQNRADGVSWAQSDDTFGWTCNAMDPEINSQGFRDTKDFKIRNNKSGKTRVMILGDSFMFGAGVSVNENVPNLLQNMLRDKFEVFNLGVPGWGIDQMYLCHQQYKDIILPKIVILAFIDHDVNRVLEAYRIAEGMNKVNFTIINGKLVFRKVPHKNRISFDNIIAKSIFLSQIIRQIYLLKVARPIVNTIFLRMTKETNERNEKFIVVRILNKENINFIYNFVWGLKSSKNTVKNANVKYLEPMQEMIKIPKLV